MEALEEVRRAFGEDAGADGEELRIRVLALPELRQRERRGDAVDVGVPVPGHEHYLRLLFVHDDLPLRDPAD